MAPLECPRARCAAADKMAAPSSGGGRILSRRRTRANHYFSFEIGPLERVLTSALLRATEAGTSNNH